MWTRHPTEVSSRLESETQCLRGQGPEGEVRRRKRRRTRRKVRKKAGSATSTQTREETHRQRPGQVQGEAGCRRTCAGGAQAAAGWGGRRAVSTEGGEPRGHLWAQERQDLPGEDLKYRDQRKTVGIGRSRGNQGTWCAKS